VEKALRGGDCANEVKDKINASGLKPVRRPAAAALNPRTGRAAEVILLEGRVRRGSDIGPRKSRNDQELAEGLQKTPSPVYPQHAASRARLGQDRLHVYRRADRIRRHQTGYSLRRANRRTQDYINGRLARGEDDVLKHTASVRPAI